jgi:hypothetical protein
MIIALSTPGKNIASLRKRFLIGRRWLKIPLTRNSPSPNPSRKCARWFSARHSKSRSGKTQNWLREIWQADCPINEFHLFINPTALGKVKIHVQGY